MTMGTMEEMSVQNIDEDPCEQKKPCSANYTAMEDVMVTMVYFKTSEDSICGAKQKGHTYRSKVELAYNTIKKQQEEKEAQDLLQPSYLRAMETMAMPYPARTGLLLYQCFQKTISPPIIEFISIEQSNPIASGEELKVWKRCLHHIYKAMYLSEFKFYSCYEFAKDHPKFPSLFSMEMTTNQSVVDEDGDVVVENKCKDGVGSANKHPVGMKRVKQMKKEDEMVDRLSQKFGIMLNKTTNDEETTQMKTMTKPSPAMQEALAGFLSITGQGMSAWMMQSMSNASSDEIKEHANEIMKQQILKIHHDNAKMMKEHTEMKSLSSSSSTPPANDILSKSTNTEILSAPSLPKPDNENEKEKEEKEEDNDSEEDIYT